MKFWAYWHSVNRHALAETGSLLGFERPARAVVGAIVYVIYAAIIWRWLGADEARSDVLSTIAAIIAPVFVLPIIWALKIMEAPPHFAREAAAQIAALTARSEAGVPARDMTIGDLFRHIRPDVLESDGNGAGNWLRVGEEVQQAFADGRCMSGAAGVRQIRAGRAGHRSQCRS